MTGPAGERDRLRDRFRGALAGVAVGDGLGAPFQGMRGPVRVGDLHLGGTDTHRPVTADTTLTIGVAESLLFRGHLDPDHLAATFATAYVREPFRGYGPTTGALLRAYANGGAWDELAPVAFNGEGSWGNGAAARSVPVALHASGSSRTAADLTRIASSVTHVHPHALECAAILTTAVVMLIEQDQPIAPASFVAVLSSYTEHPAVHDRLLEVVDLVEAECPAGDPRWRTGVDAIDSVPTAIALFLVHQQSFADAIGAAIALGGDTGTVAAMVGALAGARHGAAAIPAAWLDGTERVEHLLELADRFAMRAVERLPVPSTWSPTG